MSNTNCHAEDINLDKMVRHFGNPLAWNITNNKIGETSLHKVSRNVGYWQFATWTLNLRLRTSHSTWSLGTLEVFINHSQHIVGNCAFVNPFIISFLGTNFTIVWALFSFEVWLLQVEPLSLSKPLQLNETLISIGVS